MQCLSNKQERADGSEKKRSTFFEFLKFTSSTSKKISVDRTVAFFVLHTLSSFSFQSLFHQRMRAVEFIIREEKIQDVSMANFALSSSLEHNLRDDARFFSSGGPFSMSDRKAALFFIRIHYWSLSTAMLLGLHMDFKQGLFEAIPPPLVFYCFLGLRRLDQLSIRASVPGQDSFRSRTS